MNKNQKIISITDLYLTFLQVKENGVPIFHQVDIQGLDDAGIIKKIAGMPKSFMLKNGQVIAMIARQDALVRFMTLPSGNIQEIKKMVALQIDSIVPYTIEDIIFDVKVIGEDGAGKSKVMVVIVPRAIIERHWKIYMKAGVLPSKVVMSSFGAWLWYCRRPLDKTGVALIMDINAVDGEVSICSNAHVLASRAFRMPKAELTVNQADFLLNEINSTIEGYVQEKIGLLPSKIIITGSKTLAGDVLETFKKEYELPVEQIEQDKMLQGSRGSTTAMIGLSAGDLDKSIDLSPTDLVQDQVKENVKWALIRMMAAVLLLVVTVAVMGLVHMNRKRAYLENLNEEWAQTKKQIDDMEKTKVKLNAMTQAFNNRVMVADMMKMVAQSAPESITLSNMNLSSERVLSMQGMTSKQGDVNVFQENLVRSALFINVKLDFVNKRTTQDGESSYFKISCQLK